MKKLQTYFFYLLEYLKYGDFASILSSIKYLTTRTSHQQDRVIQTSIGLFFCRKNTNDFQFANYRYEWGMKKYIYENLNDFTVFIDGGACIGHYSILFAKQGIPVIAIEPVPQNFEVLKKNVELNGVENKIRLYNVGLGDTNRMAAFFFDPVNTGASHISRNPNETNCTVELRTMDSLIPDFGLQPEERILIKLDIEGMEEEAILGAKEFIRKYPNITLLLEDKHTWRETIQQSLSWISPFKFGIVDDYNMYAKKLSPLKK